MKIAEYIPVGRENAITRTQLKKSTGLTDRKIRDMIADERRETVILNMQDGKGYFKPRLPEEIELVENYKHQEEARLKSIGWSLMAVRKMIKKVTIN